MNLGWLWSILRFFSTFIGGKGYRAKVEVRSEASIEAEKKKLNQLTARIIGIEAQINETTIKAVAEMQAIKKGQGDPEHLARLDTKREWLFKELRNARREYDDAQGHSD